MGDTSASRFFLCRQCSHVWIVRHDEERAWIARETVPTPEVLSVKVAS